MNSARVINLDTRRFVSLGEDLPQAYFFLEGGRIGNGPLLASEMDSNEHRTVYLVRVETLWGELSAMFEVPPTRESEAAQRALDACVYGFENGAVATLSTETGFWSVSMDGETIATACSREDALAIATKLPATEEGS